MKIILRGGPYGNTTREIDGAPEQWLIPKPVEITLGSLTDDDVYSGPSFYHYRKTSDVKLYPNHTWLWVYEYNGEY